MIESFDGVRNVAKIVASSDNHDLVAATTEEAREKFGDHVSAAQSQPYYLDITHPRANKGEVVDYLSAHLGIPGDQFATIGDMPNDVLMFARSGLSIAMGNASPEVQRAARRDLRRRSSASFYVESDRTDSRLASLGSNR